MRGTFRRRIGRAPENRTLVRSADQIDLCPICPETPGDFVRQIDEAMAGVLQMSRGSRYPKKAFGFLDSPELLKLLEQFLGKLFDGGRALPGLGLIGETHYDDLLDLDAALDRLTTFNERAGQVVRQEYVIGAP